MVLVARSVRQVREQDGDGPDAEPVSLESLRTVPAWVLLGEPGAGKSAAFKAEAEATQGQYLTIAQFIFDDTEDEWKNRSLFLDGLDEIRASGASHTILHQVRSKLKRLGQPNFRISCRAADWYGQSDRTEVAAASPNGNVTVYTLEPLNQADIKRILECNFERADADDFIEQADKHGIGALLRNPQTLELTVKSLRGVNWPESRDETYRLACEALIQEENRKHRDRTRHQPSRSGVVLDIAGQLYAAMLLGDKTGIALDPSARNERFPALQELDAAEPGLAEAALKTKLFFPSSSNEERLEPPHRSIAEYLAAQWMGKQLDRQGLPLLRLRNLMMGFDGKAVAGLRGLYGWLALKSGQARPWLIDNDPLTVALYSDPKPMDLASKRQLLRAIEHQTQTNPSVLWDLRGAENLGALFEPDLCNDFAATLQSAKRDDATQTYVIFILKALQQTSNASLLAADLQRVAADATRWERVRRHALEAWMASACAADVIDFLNQLSQRKIADQDDELTGILLDKLFPGTLSASEVMRHLHVPKSTMLGMYQHFWAYNFPRKVSDSDLPHVLDELAQRSDLQNHDWRNFHLSRMLAAVVARAIQAHGDSIPDTQLFEWLRVGTDEYGERRHEPEFDQAVVQWLSARPDRYKGLLGVCFERNEHNPKPLHALFNDKQVLRGIPAPPDTGQWHFERVVHTKNDILVQEHLAEAVRSLWIGQPSQQLSLDVVLEWAQGDAKCGQWLEPLLMCEIPEWRKAQNQAVQDRKQQQAEIVRQRSIKLSSKIPEISQGTAAPALMGELAGVWLGRYTDTRGDTPLDRFKSYCENYQEVFDAAKQGLPACTSRRDLPSIAEIIDLHLQQKAHWIRSACLLGMELLWELNPKFIDGLAPAVLAQMVCFRLTDGTQNSPAWFEHLVMGKPDFVSHVLIDYASASFKAKKDYVDSIYVLERDSRYASLARLSVPTLLKRFPTRQKSSQLHHLAHLLRAALRYRMPELAQIVGNKVQLKTLDPAQRVYFLAAGMAINPARYEEELWLFVEGSSQRVQHLSDFFGSQLSDLSLDLKLNATTFGKLIEIQTPFAEVDWPMGGGAVSPAMRSGDLVRSLISKLIALANPESLDEVNRLLALPTMTKISRHLLSGKNELIQKLRENSFSHPTLLEVTSILSNRAPVSAADLQAIVLDHLDQITLDIKTSNKDLFRLFWSEGAPNRHKSENSCRDALLSLLSARLESLGVDCQPEVDYVNDKRADIRVSYRNQYVLPIEIKGEWHPKLWTAIQEQLVAQYTTPRETTGYGVYLVLWAGGNEQPAPKDGGKRAKTSEELASRLQAFVAPELQKLVRVRTLDISWPT